MPYENMVPARNSILEELVEHVDTVVTVFTEKFVYTGLLVGISEDAIKLVNRSSGYGKSSKVTLVRIDRIQAATFSSAAS